MLDSLALSKGLADGFEGNPQSFRIVTKLAFRSSEVEGLNLTRATLNAILKYPWTRGTAGKKNRKWGAYHSEETEFRFARKLSPPGDDTQCPEAAIMDWADDITYSVHDLEDFYRARLVPLHILPWDKRERSRFYDGAQKRLKTVEEISDSEMTALIDTFEKFIVSIPLDSAYAGTQLQRADLRTVTAGLISRYVRSTQLVEPAKGQVAVQVPAGFKREVKMLKELTWFYVIQNPALATQQFGQSKVIEELFKSFHDIVALPAYRHVFPASTQEELENAERKSDKSERDKETTRIIIDLIASMTERHALNMHQRLTGVSLGSALDYIDR